MAGMGKKKRKIYKKFVFFEKKIFIPNKYGGNLPPPVQFVNSYYLI